MAQIAISSFVLCIALYLIARHEAEISLPVILMITVGVSVISILLSLAIGPFAFLVALFILAYAIDVSATSAGRRHGLSPAFMRSPTSPSPSAPSC